MKNELCTIWVRWSFHGFHRYPDAPKDVNYLTSPHRHKFYVHVELEVEPLIDRELEFHQVLTVLKSEFKTVVNDQDTGSCEAMCTLLTRIIADHYPKRAYAVSVNEDEECGATKSTLHNCTCTPIADRAAQYQVTTKTKDLNILKANLYMLN